MSDVPAVKLAPAYDWKVTAWKALKALLIYVGSAILAAAVQALASFLSDGETLKNLLGAYGGGALQAAIMSIGYALGNWAKNRKL